MRKSEYQHPALGDIGWNAELHSWEAEVALAPDRPIRLLIVVEADWSDAEPQKLFAIAVAYLDWARRAEPACRERIADDLWQLYNHSWADDDPDEGPPPLERPAFVARLGACGISLYHDGSAAWMYDSGDLFAGHGIAVRVGADRVFGRASLFG